MISMLACVAAIPVIIHYESTKHYTATVQVNAKPQAVYQTAIRVIEGKPDVEIAKKDEAKLLVEADRGKKQSVSIHAASVDANKTQLIVTADAGEKQQEDKELALKVVKAICDELGVNYTVVKK